MSGPPIWALSGGRSGFRAPIIDPVLVYDKLRPFLSEQLVFGLNGVSKLKQLLKNRFFFLQPLLLVTLDFSKWTDLEMSFLNPTEFYSENPRTIWVSNCKKFKDEFRSMSFVSLCDRVSERCKLFFNSRTWTECSSFWLKNNSVFV